MVHLRRAGAFAACSELAGVAARPRRIKIPSGLAAKVKRLLTSTGTRTRRNGRRRAPAAAVSRRQGRGLHDRTARLLWPSSETPPPVRMTSDHNDDMTTTN